ncbi:hypothetical protein F4778DRAFT_779151 [Xylariomycetidae sp. FL2044]|nr:hypothetical protein F4778DRAFT_779151 [Xylariomycetidae sp. FL2044]
MPIPRPIATEGETLSPEEEERIWKALTSIPHFDFSDVTRPQGKEFLAFANLVLTDHVQYWSLPPQRRLSFVEDRLAELFHGARCFLQIRESESVFATFPKAWWNYLDTLENCVLFYTEAFKRSEQKHGAAFMEQSQNENFSWKQLTYGVQEWIRYTDNDPNPTSKEKGQSESRKRGRDLLEAGDETGLTRDLGDIGKQFEEMKRSLLDKERQLQDMAEKLKLRDQQAKDKDRQLDEKIQQLQNRDQQLVIRDQKIKDSDQQLKQIKNFQKRSEQFEEKERQLEHVSAQLDILRASVRQLKSASGPVKKE